MSTSYTSYCFPFFLLQQRCLIFFNVFELPFTGEAIYVDDIPSPEDCLHGAFIYSIKPLARVNCVRYESESFPVGVIDIVSYKDIPHGGKNIGAKTIFGMDSLFADDLTRCAGENIALVVRLLFSLSFPFLFVRILRFTCSSEVYSFI